MFAVRVPRSGLRYAAALEWGLTAQWWGCDWDTFETLGGETQSFMVAVYRTKHQIDAVLMHDAERRRARAARRK